MRVRKDRDGPWGNIWTDINSGQNTVVCMYVCVLCVWGCVRTHTQMNRRAWDLELSHPSSRM